MRITLSLCLLLLLTGCGRKTPPVAMPQQQAGVSGPLAVTHVAAVAPPAGDIFQGRTASQWAQETTSSNQFVRHEATQALGQLGAKGLPYLIQGMRSDSWEVRLSSMKAFTRPMMIQNEQQTLPLVVAMLNDRQAVVRQEAMLRLGWFGPGGRPALANLRAIAGTDEDAEIRRMACEIIVAMHPGLPALVQLLNDDLPQVRQQVISRLLFLGPAARPAVPALEQVATNDPVPEVRQAAQGALLAIR